MKRQTLSRLLVLSAALFLTTSYAQNNTAAYPNKQITLIVSYAPGGNVDLRARTLGMAVSKTLGVPVIVENKPGANGNIGHEFVAKAAPDGYTLVLATMGPMAVSSFVYPRLGFNPEESFQPIALIEKAPLVLVTKTDKPFQSVKDLVNFGQKNPDKLSFGNAGAGSAHHLSAELFSQSVGIKSLSVPYKGGSQAATALLSGEIDLLFEQSYAALPSITTGKVRALAVTSEKRMISLPNVPTLSELGYPKAVVYNWLGLAAPKGTPAHIIKKLNDAFNQALAQPDIKEKIAAPGNIVGNGSPEDFKSFISSERLKWAPIVKSLNISPE
jgi:tripartite-type tricarboxylate transporter receptor subunit TctC